MRLSKSREPGESTGSSAMKRKLGTDGKRLYIRLADGRELSVDPSQLAYTNRLILYRQSRKLTEIQVLKRQLKNWA
jgi:hypothetical protein